MSKYDREFPDVQIKSQILNRFQYKKATNRRIISRSEQNRTKERNLEKGFADLEIPFCV